jgi:protein TonB
MRKSLTLTLGVALLAGCAQHSAPLSLHEGSTSHIPQRTHRAHLTRLGCVYLRERLGLPALGSPPPAAPGLQYAQPSSPPSPSRATVEAYLTASTNCAPSAPQVSTPAPPAYTPPQLATSRPAVAAYYPPAALRIGTEGTAIVRICVGPSGRVTSVSLARSSGSPLLDGAALRYARATSGHWHPASRDGRPISACTRLPVRFSPLGGF